MTLEIFSVSVWKFGWFSSIPRKRARTQKSLLTFFDRRPFLVIPMVRKICLFQWNHLLQENKKDPVAILFLFPLSCRDSPFCHSVNSLSLEPEWGMIGERWLSAKGIKGKHVFIWVMLVLSFLAKILVTLNCWFCLCPSSLNFKLIQTLAPIFFMWGLTAATYTCWAVGFFTFTGINSIPYYIFLHFI